MQVKVVIFIFCLNSPGDGCGVHVILLSITLASFPNLDALVAVSKGTWATKLCCTKIVQFQLRVLAIRLNCIMAIKCLLLKMHYIVGLGRPWCLRMIFVTYCKVP